MEEKCLSITKYYLLLVCNTHCTCGCCVSFPALSSCLTSSPDDFKRRLDAQKVPSLLFEELDPCEQNHTALVLLPQLVQPSAQRAHLRRSGKG